MKASSIFFIALLSMAGLTLAQSASGDQGTSSGITSSTDPAKAAAVERQARDIQSRQQPGSSGASDTTMAATSQDQAATTQQPTKHRTKHAKRKSGKKHVAKSGAGTAGSTGTSGAAGTSGAGMNSSPDKSSATGSGGTNNSKPSGPSGGY